MKNHHVHPKIYQPYRLIPPIHNQINSSPVSLWLPHWARRRRLERSQPRRRRMAKWCQHDGTSNIKLGWNESLRIVYSCITTVHACSMFCEIGYHLDLLEMARRKMKSMLIPKSGWNINKITLLRVIPTPWHLYILLLANLLAFYLTYLLAFYLAYLLANLLAFYLTYLLAFYLAYLLAFYLAYLLAYYLLKSSGILSGKHSGTLSGISSGILSDILSGIYLAYLVAFYLAYLLTFYLAYLMALYLAYLMAFYLAYLLAFYLTFYLAYLLAIYLAFEVQRCALSSEGPRLRSSGAHWARQVPGWGPAVRTELGRSQVEVQRCARSWEGPRLRSSSRHWAPKLAKSLAKSWQGNSGPGSGGKGGRRGGWRGGGGGRRRRRTTLIKSNNPHLAGGEIHLILGKTSVNSIMIMVYGRYIMIYRPWIL